MRPTNAAHLRSVCAGVNVGISANLADKARMLGIPVWRLGNGGA
jgi:hypothetical protein